jgi:hypothetical protein
MNASALPFRLLISPFFVLSKCRDMEFMIERLDHVTSNATVNMVFMVRRRDLRMFVNFKYSRDHFISEKYKISQHLS